MNTTQGQSVATSGTVRSVSTMSPFVVLHIEDSRDDRELFQIAAAQAKLPICWQTANSTKTAIAHLKELLTAAAAGASVTCHVDLAVGRYVASAGGKGVPFLGALWPRQACCRVSSGRPPKSPLRTLIATDR